MAQRHSARPAQLPSGSALLGKKAEERVPESLTFDEIVSELHRKHIGALRRPLRAYLELSVQNGGGQKCRFPGLGTWPFRPVEPPHGAS